jgi:ATP-dependent helicase/nuclease subunit A
MSAKLHSDRPDRLIDRERRACYMRLGRWTPIELATNEAIEIARDEAEGVRVAYVAATRARDLLVVPGVGDVPWENGWTSPLNGAIYPEPSRRRTGSPAAGCPPFRKDSVFRRPDDEAATPMTVCPGQHAFAPPGAEPYSVVWWDPHEPGLILGVEPTPGIRREGLIMKDVPEAVVQDGLREYERWRTTREQTIAAGSTPSLGVRTATEWAASAPVEDAHADRSIDKAAMQPGLFDERSPEPPPPAANVAGNALEDHVTIVDASGEMRPGGLRFGELVHGALAAIPLNADSETIDGLVEVQARIVSATVDEAAAARATVARVLAHELLVRARAADARGACRRETPVTCTLDDGTLVEGIVDLAFEQDGAWTIIDYKTDRELASAEQVYRRQIALYASAISRATALPASAFLVRV